MKFDFDTLANRNNIGNMKYIMTSDAVKKAGVISYVGAEMDFKTAPVIIDAIIKTAKNGLPGFTICDDNYLDAIKWWMDYKRNWKIEKEWIVPTLGTIHSVATTIRLLTKEGEGIIVQPPIYNRYEQAARRVKRRTVYNELLLKNGRYSIDFNNLEKCMADEKNKLMILCNPHNPIGQVWDVDDLKVIAALAKKHNVVVFSDEIFAEVVFDEYTTTPYSTIKDAENNCIVSTSLGKTFNFTGVNNANMIIPNKKLREAFIGQRDADHYGSIDPMAYTSVCAAYSEEGALWVDEMNKYVKNNINYICDFFAKHMPQVNILGSEGGFILWIDWNNLKLTEEDLYNFLINEAFFELDPGSNYGDCGVGFSRMSIAAPHAEIEKSLALLLKAAKNRGFAK